MTPPALATALALWTAASAGPPATPAGAGPCAACHEAVVEEWTASAHKLSADCAACHPTAARLDSLDALHTARTHALDLDSDHPHLAGHPTGSAHCVRCHADVQATRSDDTTLFARPQPAQVCGDCHFPPVLRSLPLATTPEPDRSYPDKLDAPAPRRTRTGRTHHLSSGTDPAATERVLASLADLRILQVGQSPGHVDVHAVLTTSGTPHVLPLEQASLGTLLVVVSLQGDRGLPVGVPVTATLSSADTPGLSPTHPTSLHARIPVPPEAQVHSASITVERRASPDQPVSLLAADQADLARAPTPGPAWWSRGIDAALQRGDTERATLWLDQLSPDSPDHSVLSARVALQRGDLATASDALGRVPDEQRWQPEVRVLQALLAEAEGDHPTATDHWRAAAVGAPTHWSVLRHWQQAASRSGDARRAAQIQETLVSLDAQERPTDLATPLPHAPCALDPRLCAHEHHIEVPPSPAGR